MQVGHPFGSWIDGSGACKRDAAQVYDLGGITVSVCGRPGMEVAEPSEG